MLTALYVVPIVILLFGLTIFVHELGHFLVARSMGMVIDVFSIGFGPAIWKRKHKGITYKIGILPLGGYVSLPQLDPASMSAVQGKSENGHDEGGRSPLPPAPPGAKILVSLAGATGNILLAFAVAWIVYLAASKATVPGSKNIVLGYVATNSPAYAAGLSAGDQILAVNDERVQTWQSFLQLVALAQKVELTVESTNGISKVVCATAKDEFGMRGVPGIEAGAVCRVLMVEAGSSAAEAGVQSGDAILIFDGIRVGGSRHLIELVSKRAGLAVPMEVERGGKKIQLTVTPRLDPHTGRARIGIQFDSIGVQLDELAAKRPWEQIRYDATAIVRVLRALVTPKESKQAAESLGGPAMILVTFWYMVKLSLLASLSFTRLLNVNLAILNLLPIPVLDGGHILFAFWEMVTRRPISPKVVNVLVNVFATILIALFLFLSYRDVGRLWKIRRLLTGDRSDGTNGHARIEAVASTNMTAPASTGAVSSAAPLK